MSGNESKDTVSGADWGPDPEAPRDPDVLLADRRRDRKYRELRSALAHMERELEAKDHTIERLLDLQETQADLKVTLSPKRGPRHRGLSIQLASDWHYEEEIRPETVGHLNEYNIEIARNRIHSFFELFQWRIEYDRGAAQVDDAVLWLGGDMMHGHIHEENLEVSQLTPLHAQMHLEDLIAAGIEFLLCHVERLIVPCNWGNHGRDTARKRYTTGAWHNYEFQMYCRLRQKFADNDRVLFEFTEGEWTRLEINEFRIATHHGDFFRYAGGVGGHHVPLMGKIRQLNMREEQRADFYFYGHHHHYLPGPVYLGNGALPGYSAYANGNALMYERPLQASAFLDVDEKLVVACRPVWFT